MRLPALAALALLLSGCLASPSSAPAPSSAAPASTTIPWGFSKCTYLVGWAPVDPAAIQPFLPKGFVAAPYGPVATGTPADRAMLGFESFRCESGIGLDNATIPGMTYASYWSAVTPPDEYKVQGVTSYDVRWDTLIPDAARRDAMLSAGLPARDGKATVTPSATGAAAEYTMTGVGSGSNQMQMTITRTIASPKGGPFVEFTPTKDGTIAVWRGDSAWDGSVSQGYGTIAPAPGSWAAQVVGRSQVPAQFHTGVWTFSNATLTIPSR